MHLGAFCIANAPSRETRRISRDPAHMYRPRASPLSRNSSLSTNCNFRRIQIVTLVVGQLYSGWVG